MANLGRNDPCACGSGRKYKHCCLPRVDAARALRVRLRAAEARVVPEILDFADERWGKELVEPAWNEFVMWTEDEIPEDLADDPDYYPLFLPWFLFTYIPDPQEEDAPDDLPEVPLALAYLDEADDVEDLARGLIESACRGGFSFHVVTRVDGEALQLRDILTGAETRLLQEGGAEDIRPDEILFAFPAGVGGGSVLLGCAPLSIAPTWHNRIIDFREATWEGSRPRPEDLRDYDFEIREFYFDIADAIYNPQPPQLTNTDGEPFELTTLSYELRCSIEEALELFKGLGPQHPSEAAAAEGDEDVERGPDGAIVRATVRWLNDTETLLGIVAIEAGALSAEVNSAARAARMKEEISARLGDRAMLIETQTVSAEEMYAKAFNEADGELEDVEEPDAAQVIVEAEVMAKHWERWLDEPIPALGDVTPREAAASPLGRERLEALFAEYRWRSQMQPAHVRADIPALRQKLGI